MILTKQEISSALHICKCHRYRNMRENSARKTVRGYYSHFGEERRGHRGDEEEGADRTRGLSESLSWSFNETQAAGGVGERKRDR